MDNHHAENRNEALLTLQAGFNELIRNAYIQGFKDGQEFGIKLSANEVINMDNDSLSDFISELSLDEAKVLLEAEKILNEYL
ncbi:MAG: hypothetical protein JW762_10990 [Dehalococcoidales bacterium]|nr:hypothetical protein [Dehalococcoidales bacterium]